MNKWIEGATWNSYKTIFQKYSNLFNLASLPKNRHIDLNLLRKKLVEDDPLYEIKLQIEKILWRMNETIVITLDDIDRMEPEEIMIILKLVKLLSDFPKIIFILLLDEKRVSNIITKKVLRILQQLSTKNYKFPNRTRTIYKRRTKSYFIFQYQEVF